MHGYWRNPEETARVLAGRLAGHRRRRPSRRQGPDHHHRPQEGPDRQRQGRQCLAAAGRGHADAAARNRAGDGLWRPPAAPGRAAGPRRRRFASSTPDLQQRLSKAVDRVNADLSVIERVRRFIVADEPFTIENEQLTPSTEDPPPRHQASLWRAARRALRQVASPRRVTARVGHELAERRSYRPSCRSARSTTWRCRRGTAGAAGALVTIA